MHTSASSCQNNLIMSHVEPICGVNFRQNEALTVSYIMTFRVQSCTGWGKCHKRNKHITTLSACITMYIHS